MLFLRKLCEGGVAHSFGIHVARLAGMPQAVVESAQRKLNRLESTRDQEKEMGEKLSGREKRDTDLIRSPEEAYIQ